MASNATIAVAIVTDASKATRGLDQTAGAVEKVGREAKTAGDRIDDMGSKSGQTTSGLRDMADAVGMLGFPGLASAMGTAAVGFEAIDGAATLFGAHSALLSKVLGGVTKAMNVLKVSILTNPIFIIAAVLIAIVAVFVLLYVKCEGFRKIVDAVFKAVLNVIKGVWEWLKSTFALVFDILSKPFKLWLAVVKTVLGTAKDVIGGVVDWVGDVFGKVYDFITAPFRKAMDWLKSHFKLPSLPSWLPGDQGPSAAGVFMPQTRGPSPTTATATAAPPPAVIVTDEQIYRAVSRLILRGDARNGRLVVVG